MKEITPMHPIVKELVGAAYPISLYMLSYSILRHLRIRITASGIFGWVLSRSRGGSFKP